MRLLVCTNFTSPSAQQDSEFLQPSINLMREASNAAYMKSVDSSTDAVEAGFMETGSLLKDSSDHRQVEMRDEVFDGRDDCTARLQTDILQAYEAVVISLLSQLSTLSALSGQSHQADVGQRESHQSIIPSSSRRPPFRVQLCYPVLYRGDPLSPPTSSPPETLDLEPLSQQQSSAAVNIKGKICGPSVVEPTFFMFPTKKPLLTIGAYSLSFKTFQTTMKQWHMQLIRT